jgi:hypothetical protein
MSNANNKFVNCIASDDLVKIRCFLFLDIDDTVNNGPQADVKGDFLLNKDMISILNRIADKRQDVGIVIQSNQRTRYSIEGLRRIFHSYGLSEKLPIIGKTPDLTESSDLSVIVTSMTKGSEIRSWIDTHLIQNLEYSALIFEWVNFAILDDYARQMDDLRHRCVEVGINGITQESIDDVLWLFEDSSRSLLDR